MNDSVKCADCIEGEVECKACQNNRETIDRLRRVIQRSAKFLENAFIRNDSETERELSMQDAYYELTGHEWVDEWTMRHGLEPKEAP